MHQVYLHNGEALGAMLFDIAAPDWRAVNFEALFRGMAHINRFNGATRRPVSVLEHSLAVTSLVPPAFRLAALLHDAHEPVIGDMVFPVECWLDKHVEGFGRVMARLREQIDLAVIRAAIALAGVAAPAAEDVMLLSYEMRAEPVRVADLSARMMEEDLFITRRRERAQCGIDASIYREEAPAPESMIGPACLLLERLVTQRFGRVSEAGAVVLP